MEENKNIPEIRFKGFEGEWEDKKLVDIGYTYTGLSGKNKTDFGHGKGRYVTYMNVFSNTIAKKENTEAIEVDHSQNNVQFGDVFFTTSSETPEEVGMSSVWLADCQDTYLNSFCFGYRPVIKVDNYYFAYLLRSTVIRKEIIFLAQGISRYNISKNKVMEISVPLPNIEEQSQIGSYFQNLDQQITLEQQKHDKLVTLKKAMLEKMFPKEGASVPEIRFDGFERVWEKKILGEEAEIVAGGDIDKNKLLEIGKYPVIANALTNDGILGYYNDFYRIKAPAVTVTGRGDVGHAQARKVDFTPVVRLLVLKSVHDVDFLENAINMIKVVVESTGVPQLTVPQIESYKIFIPEIEEQSQIGSYFQNLDKLISLQQQKIDKLKNIKKACLDKMFV